MADFCSRCGKTLSLIDPLLELKGLRFCEDCYPDVKREHAAASFSDKRGPGDRSLIEVATSILNSPNQCSWFSGDTPVSTVSLVRLTWLRTGRTPTASSSPTVLGGGSEALPG